MKRFLSKGHRNGGPWHFGLVLTLCVGACSGGGGPGEPAPERAAAIARPLEVYEQLGLLTGTPDYPAVASFATMAGPGDSTYVLLGLSLPNSALRFQRERAEGFVSRYSVEATFTRDGQRVHQLTERATVRVREFDETDRTDESVVFQKMVALPPGEYVVDIVTRDERSANGAALRDTIRVPDYGDRGTRLSEPLFVYRATARTARRDRPDVILNPRHTVYYGAVPPKLYLEGYGVSEGEPITVRVVDDSGEAHWSAEMSLRGDDGVRHAILDIPAESLPLGRHWIEVVASGDTMATAESRSPLVVTISDQWLVANFDEMLEFLRFIATSEEIDSLESVSGEERQERWTAFWRRRDPLPATAANEFRNEFFERIRAATIHFSEPGMPGWRTDRGEVYIVLGPPSGIFEGNARNRNDFGRPMRVLWVYERLPGGRLELVFEDDDGFGRYELTPSSESRFRSIAQRVKQRQLRARRRP